MEAWDIDIENVAGIRSASATIAPGVNAVQAENWRGKSSFIAAVETAMGTARPLTEGREAGRVELRTGAGTYGVDLVRRNGQVVTDGEPLLEAEYDRVCAALFACLDGRNEVRAAVRRGENLEDVLTRPLAFENIDERIESLRRERDRVGTELARAREAAEALPDAQEAVTGLEDELEALRDRRDDLEVPAGADDSAREELSEVRAERERIDARIERLEASVARAEERLAERRAELDSMEDPDGDTFTATLEEARADLAAVERDLELLQSAYAAAKQLVEEDRFDLLADVEHGVLDDTVTCLLCGGSVERSGFADHLEAIDERVAELRERADRHRDRVEELEAARSARIDRDRRREGLEADVADLEGTIADREESLAQAEARFDELDARLEELAAAVDDLDDERTDVESEIKFVEAELETARSEVEDLTARADRRSHLESQRDGIAEELESLRNRKDRIKRRTREAFDEAMADLLARFDIGFETARLTAGFDLVVAREGREASLDALSEGELELIGLVAALAGHQAFEVDEIVPVLLLDDVGGLSDGNLHTVVGMLRDHVDRVVVTAYPEHSSFDGHAIDPSAWSVVSDDAAATGPS